jgi:heme/copper-type cytochrome/quinol oxidase subunit 2
MLAHDRTATPQTRGEAQMELGTDTEVVLLAAGLIFLWALALGVWKYRQMAGSDDHLAHPYVDTAHRAALLYSFAALLVATFVQFSGWNVIVNLLSAGAVVLFFVASIGTYVYHGWRRDTDNQLRDQVRGTTAFMIALIIAEIGGFTVLVLGFVRAQLL